MYSTHQVYEKSVQTFCRKKPKGRKEKWARGGVLDTLGEKREYLPAVLKAEIILFYRIMMIVYDIWTH